MANIDRLLDSCLQQGNCQTLNDGLSAAQVYSQWERHDAEAMAVYDGIIEKQPSDFRGYLAKGVLLRRQGRKGDAQRAFLQARYNAPPESRGVIDRVIGVPR